MCDWHRPVGRFFIALLSAWMLTGWMAGANPSMTTVTDTVLRADECLNASVWAKADVGSSRLQQ